MSVFGLLTLDLSCHAPMALAWFAVVISRHGRAQGSIKADHRALRGTSRSVILGEPSRVPLSLLETHPY